MKLAFDDAGRGESVVLIHGHPFDRTLWGPQLAALRDAFRVVVPDLRGFGESPVTAREKATRRQRADAVERDGMARPNGSSTTRCAASCRPTPPGKAFLPVYGELESG
ncbi:MAG TPA: alpha/beta fold hydrolase [Streptosporangiaceae bacterium]|nr:alpha/beta fold hydrolase [Streptosporangiaceae bacterium]